MHAQKVEDSKEFAIWPLSMAAEGCFGAKDWPEEFPKPQAWLEIEVEEASKEMERKGYRLLLKNFEVPYGQIVSRFLSPEGILIGPEIAPWLRDPDKDTPMISYWMPAPTRKKRLQCKICFN